MPIGILLSLGICTILYILFAHVMTGVSNYHQFAGKDGIAPVAVAIDHMGKAGADGVVVPDYPWLNKAILMAILGGYASVILVMLMGQSRVFFAMSHDGLLPSVFSRLHSKFRTPAKNNLLFMLFVSIFAAFVPSRVVGEMTSIGTLFAFILVCIGVIIMRKKMPEAPRAFRAPLVPLVPILGVGTCLFMMVFLPLDTWIRLIVWMMIGLDVYLFYGMRKSHLNKDTFDGKSYRIVTLTGMALVALLIVVAMLYRDSDAGNTGLFYFSIVFAIIQLLIFIMEYVRKKNATMQQ